MIRRVALSTRTLAVLARPFEGGGGPSHASIELIWTSADAFEYLPAEGNKLDRVLGGLRTLQAGRKSEPGTQSLQPDEDKLRLVVAASQCAS
jgi:hypothetical protein